MDNIFIREVVGSAINNDKYDIREIKVSSGKNVYEFLINKDIIDKLYKKTSNKGKLKLKDKIMKLDINRKRKVYDKKILKYILNNFEEGTEYTIAPDFKRNNFSKRIQEILEVCGLGEYTCKSELRKNINKYIEEYMIRKNLVEGKIRILLCIDNINNLDMRLVENLNNMYKEVNIYSLNKPGKRVLYNIDKINEQAGTAITVINKINKDFKIYNVSIYLDDGKAAYSKCKFKSNILNIDITNIESDKFNSKFLELKERTQRGEFVEQNIKNLNSIYGPITVANVILK